MLSNPQNSHHALNLHQVAFGLRSGVLGASNNRMGVWTQGCSLTKCSGCASVHTWSAAKGTLVPVDKLIILARGQSAAPSGLTISGGEPTDQSVVVRELVKQFRSAFPGTEVLLYSGMPWQDLERRHPELLALLDVVVAGPYEGGAATPLAGSANQTVRLLTPLADALYGNWRDWPIHVQQVSATSERQLVTVGIPDTVRMQEAAVEARAVTVSWQRQPQAEKRVRRNRASSSWVGNMNHKGKNRAEVK